MEQGPRVVVGSQPLEIVKTQPDKPLSDLSEQEVGPRVFHGTNMIPTVSGFKGRRCPWWYFLQQTHCQLSL